MTAPTSPSRERLATDYGWTPRQREVLALIAAGKTNGEIGEALGISLDGAKWHVSEILSKLNAHSREEAADYWRAHQRPRARLARALRSIGPGAAAFKWVAGGLAVGAVAIMGVAAFAALHDGGGNAPASTTSTAAATPTVLGRIWALTTPVPIATECGPLNIALEHPNYGGGSPIPINIVVAGTKPCHVTTTISAELRWKDPANGSEQTIFGGAAKTVTVDIATPQRVAQLAWTNWCGPSGADIFLHVSFDVPAAWLDLPVPWHPTCDPKAPASALGWVANAPGVPGPAVNGP